MGIYEIKVLAGGCTSPHKSPVVLYYKVKALNALPYSASHSAYRVISFMKYAIILLLGPYRHQQIKPLHKVIQKHTEVQWCPIEVYVFLPWLCTTQRLHGCNRFVYKNTYLVEETMLV